jgi:wobble nucleotide-excising tRNase
MPDTVLPVRETLASPELLERLVAEVEKVFHGKQEVVQLAVAARRLVDLYLRVRFGTHPLDEREQRALTEALGNVRSHLRPA